MEKKLDSDSDDYVYKNQTEEECSLNFRNNFEWYISFSIKNVNDYFCYRRNKKFTLGQKVALVMLAAADFMSFCSMSIMAPFYPKEAASKGMSEAMSGFIFGYYALVVFLSSPLFGKIVRKS